ncbi:hypothetical protein [Kribbella sp. ALI-6-A]|uniref:hypothetical protein n=1 Tax=Kribbella sp. ALI-6-A TaxID=1933817 RepID=UPI0009FCA448|nr:hypothetical protein [Kribbella sp. ALI-6-A]
MEFSAVAGLGGLGFVLAAVAINVVYVRGRLPMPTSGQTLEEVTQAFATVGDALKRPSVIAPATWVFLTLFAAGVLSETWSDQPGWALVGFAGVLLQNATFTGVEALRFGLASAASHDRGSVPGLWAFSNVLFGFNQVFLAIALLGFSIAGTTSELVPAWHAILGYVSAALLFVSSSATPYNAQGSGRTGAIGLIGWLGWATWIVVYSITLLRA